VTVHTLNPLEDPRWTEFVRQHPRASIFHTQGWLEALRRTYGYQPVVYTTCPPIAELTNGLVFCRVSSWLTGHRLVSLPFADHCEPLVESPEQMQELFRALRNALEVEKWKYIEFRPLSSDFFAEPGLERGSSFHFHQLDVTPSLEKLFRGLHKDSIQRKIRRAEREALAYEEGRSELLLRKFYRLFLATRRRHTLPPQPFAWFRNLVDCLGDHLKVRVASKNEKPVASMLTLSYQDTLIYKYGCSDARSHNLGAMPFLFWQAIEEAKEHRLRYFDLGRSDSDNLGLITFKNRLGAVGSRLTYMRCSTVPTKAISASRAMNVARGIFARMPDEVLIAAGRLLYRHIG